MEINTMQAAVVLCCVEKDDKKSMYMFRTHAIFFSYIFCSCGACRYKGTLYSYMRKSTQNESAELKLP
jgi:hypothetical protein